MTIITKSTLYSLWSTGKPFKRRGIIYRCGRMSYGDYFFEPLPERGERDGFNPGTIWIRRYKNA